MPGRDQIHRHLRIAGLVAGVIAVSLVSFQNCTQMPEGSEDQNLALAKKMDFHLDTTIDQIAYMSCPNVVKKENKEPVDASMFFTIRAGAYRFGGIKLNDAFYKAYGRKTTERMADMLVRSPANSKTVVQLAVRKVGELNTLVNAPGGLKPNIDFANLFAALNSNEVFSKIIATGFDPAKQLIVGKRLRYLRDGSGLGARMEGTINIAVSESVQEELRRTWFGSQSAVLGLTYLEPTAQGGGVDNLSPDVYVRNAGTVHPEENPNTPGQAYGTGYRLNFNQPPGGAVGFIEIDLTTQTAKQTYPYPSNQLVSVSEVNLQNQTTAPTGMWVCPASLRFRIIRPGDEKDPGIDCPRVPDRDPKTDFEFGIARNAFRTEDWYINMDKRCLVQKRDAGNYSCYGNQAKIKYVQYDFTNSAGCNPYSNDESNRAAERICLAWASVCYRVNP